MRWRMLAIAIVALPSFAFGDDLWLEASAAQSSATGTRFAVSRTIDTESGVTADLGLSYFRFGDSRWTLASAGASGRVGDLGLVRAAVDIGPGHIDGAAIRYRKASLGGTLLISESWSAELSDTYINIDDTRGHVFSASVSRVFPGGLLLTLNGVRSAGGNIDTRQFGAKFRFERKWSLIGGAYSGETRNPILLNEVGTEFGGRVITLRQAYLGVGIPIGRYTLLTVFDYLRLDDRNRREIAVVLRIPLGAGGSP